MSKQIIFCNCGGEFATPEQLEFMKQSMQSLSVPRIQLNDLCGLAAKDPQALKEVFSEGKESLLVACHKRTVNKLLQFAEVDTVNQNIQHLNYRDHSVQEIKEGVKTFAEGVNELAELKTLSSPEDWPSWYPVLDYDRCTSCGQCADFCLFGVYSKDGGEVKVVNPEGCKNNCPACARICPHTAIIFPKYQEGGAISGSSNFDETEEAQRQKQDVDDILGSDIYKALEGRKRRRKSIIKKTAMEKALEEREEYLKRDNPSTSSGTEE